MARLYTAFASPATPVNPLHLGRRNRSNPCCFDRC